MIILSKVIILKEDVYYRISDIFIILPIDNFLFK
jgi:hypothetical protein